MTLIRLVGISFLTISLFASCSKKEGKKKERWAVIINFFTPDTTDYPPTKKFPFPDSLQFATLESIFTNQDKKPIITDSAILFYDTYRENGKRVCCKQDTLASFIDTIKGKKYLFAIGDYIAVFQSDTYSDSNLWIRKNISVPLWGISLNSAYPAEKFKDEHEKLGTKLVKIDPRFDEVDRQKWSSGDSVLVETIQFDNSADRIITSVYKDMNQHEVDSTINELRTKFPYLKYEEATQRDGDGNHFKIIKIRFDGIAVSFTQTNSSKYSFVMTDYYQTIKLILNNPQASYVFRDDVKVH